MLSRDEVRDVADKLDAELAEVGKRLGLKLTLGRCKYGETMEFKLEVAKVQADGTAPSREAETFKRGAALYGLQPSDLGRHFRGNGGQEFVIVGLNPRAHKMPIIGKRVYDGKRFKFSAASVKMGLALLGKPA